VDYTKGIPERLRAIESLFIHYPEYRGRLRFVQIGVPSRGDVPEYRLLAAEIAALVDRINTEWSSGSWQPITYFHKQFSRVELMGLYRLGDFCVVSPLHDGMNLVAKEYVASRNDTNGVLVLSQFAGVATELTEAVIFNPYNLDESREAIRAALEMPATERRRRMLRLRETIAENSVYRWAGKILSALSRIEFSDEALVSTCTLAR
jgi:trehalose 6-phosphate synthase